MGYSAGLLNHLATVAMRVKAETGSFGLDSGGVKYKIVGKFHAGRQFNKGAKSLREGAVDAYNVVIFRFRPHKEFDRWALIKYEGRWYQIESFNEDYQANQLQITARELTNQQVTIVDPPEPSASEI